MTLIPHHQNAIQSASPDAIVSAAARIRRFAQQGQWLQQRNVYRKDVVGRLRQQSKNNLPVYPTHLRQYIAASVPTHCLDGWTYFARALASYVGGESSTAIHLGYYAELRAAMALLGYGGIGVFNSRHVVFDGLGKHEFIEGQTDEPIRARLSTHVFAWEALDAWALSEESTRFLGAVISGGGVTLADWIGNAFPGTTVAPIAQDWLRLWGLDLKRFAEDRELRNEMSYRPSRITAVSMPEVGATVDVLADAWNIFEPYETGDFANLDRFLIRSAIERTFQRITERSPKQSKKRYHVVVQNVVSELNFDTMAAEFWISFLQDIDRNDFPDPILLQASRDSWIDKPRHVDQLLGRAALLLRVATGATERLLANSDLKQSELEFWWRPLAEGAGLASPGDDLTSMSILWGDVDGALQDLKAGGSINDRKSWLTRNAGPLMTLTGFERVGLWGLFP